MNEFRKDRCINIARSFLSKGSGGRCFHASFILDKNRIVCFGINNYKKRHLENRFGKYFPTKPNTEKYISGIHSEVSALRTFINKFGDLDVSGLTLFNIRLSINGDVMLAKPCLNCQRLLDSLAFKDIVWTL